MACISPMHRWDLAKCTDGCRFELVERELRIILEMNFSVRIVPDGARFVDDLKFDAFTLGRFHASVTGKFPFVSNSTVARAATFRDLVFLIVGAIGNVTHPRESGAAAPEGSVFSVGHGASVPASTAGAEHQDS